MSKKMSSRAAIQCCISPLVENLENRTLLATLAGGVDPNNLGKGDWIWQIASAEANYGVNSVEALAVKMKQAGFKWVIVKAGDANDGPITGTWTQFNSTLIDIFHGQGIQIFGYQYVYGGADPSPKTAVTTVEGEIAVAKEILSLGCDGLIIDAEGQYERVPVTSHGGPTGAATAYMTAIRADYPNTFIAHAPLPYITLHTAFPYEAFGKYCDAVMPQLYWKTIARHPSGTQSRHVPRTTLTPKEMVDDMDDEWSYWQEIWKSNGNADAIKPIIPIGQGYNPDTDTHMQGSEITEFVDALKNDPDPAGIGGYNGVSFWSVQHHTTTMFQAISAATIGFNGTVKGTVFNDVDGDGKRDVGDDGAVGRVVYDDVDNDKKIDVGEPQATTDAAGNYTLIDVSGPTHKIRLVPLAGWRQSTPSAGFAAKASLPNDGATVENINFATTQHALITGTVFFDRNGNSIKNSTELGVAGWRVFVDEDNDGRFDVGENSMRSDANGAYSLNVVAGSTYRVRIVPVGGWRPTLPSSGFYDVAVADGEAVSRDFGETNRLLISGFVFNDLNGNGKRDTGEAGLESWRAFIDLDDDGLYDNNEYSAFTDADGRFVLRTTPAGKRKLRVLPQTNWVSTTPEMGFHTINLRSGQSVSNRLFGEMQIA